MKPGRRKLGLALAAVGLVWLGLLPWMARQGPVSRYLDHLEETQVDPSAMYYTDLEVIKPVLERIALEKRSR